MGETEIEAEGSEGHGEYIDITNWPTLEEVERLYLFKVLKMTKGNKSKAAKILGVCNLTVYKKIEKAYSVNIESIKNEKDGEQNG